MSPKTSFLRQLQQVALALAAVTLQWQWPAQDTNGGAGDSTGVLWVSLEGNVVILEVLGTVWKVGMMLWWVLLTALTALMGAVLASSAVTWHIAVVTADWWGWSGCPCPLLHWSLALFVHPH